MTQILLIEDNQDIRENTVEALQMVGYQVTAAVNGLQGLSMALELLPEVIICDIEMPEMNGVEVLRKVKTNPATANTPFIFVTASAEKKEIQSAMAAGATGYVVKPFDPNELFDAVKLALGKHPHA
jgi:CheY-like chemotaxis protein